MELYGKVNIPTKRKEYVGITNNTTTTKVNNESGIISVDINKLPHTLRIIENGSGEIIFDGSEDKEIALPSDESIVALNQRVDNVETAISDNVVVSLDLELDNNYQVTINGKNSKNQVISTDVIDLPSENAMVNVSFNTQTYLLTFTTQNSNTIPIDLSYLRNGLQLEITSSTKLSSDLVNDSNNINKFVTQEEKNTWNGKQDALTVNQQSAVNSGITSNLVEQITTNENNIAATNNKFMNGTSIENPAANVNFVNSSIATNTATFIGTFASVEALIGINILEIGSILLAGSLIKEGSIINNGGAYEQDVLIVQDINITGVSSLEFGSIIKEGSTIAIDSWINHINYDSLTLTEEDITIETWTNNDYAFVTNNKDNPYEFDTYANLIAWSNPNMYLITNWDYAWIINTEDNTKFDLYRFDIITHSWELRVSKTNKSAVTLNNAFNRYKYVQNTLSWDYEYTLNNSSFTANQWAAINSGITNDLVTQIGTNESNISTLTTTKANKSQGAVYTLSALDWNNNTYVLSVTGKTANNNANVSIWQGDINTSISDLNANKDAIIDANLFILDTGTTLTFRCETTPTTDLKIQVEVYD